MNGLTEDQEFTDEARMSGERFVWECAVGGKDPVIVPSGGDFPMRQAVEKAFFDLTGKHPEMCYSGWGRKFTDKAQTHDTLALALADAMDLLDQRDAELNIDAALDAMEANMRADGQTPLRWRDDLPPEDQDKLRACVRAGIVAALMPKPEGDAG
jgi:hypothetical protein